MATQCSGHTCTMLAILQTLYKQVGSNVLCEQTTACIAVHFAYSQEPQVLCAWPLRPELANQLLGEAQPKSKASKLRYR